MDLLTLEARAAKRAVQEVRTNYTDEQLSAFKTDLARVELERDDEEERFADIRSEHNGIKKEKAEEARKLKSAIRKRYVDEDRECFYDPDFEAGMMNVYDAQNGLLVESRRLRPDERQTSMRQEKEFA